VFVCSYTVIIPVWPKVWLAPERIDGCRKLKYGLKEDLLMNVFESPVLQPSFFIFLRFIIFWSYILKSSICFLLWISNERQNLFLLNFWTNWARNLYYCTQIVANFKSFPNVTHFFMFKCSQGKPYCKTFATFLSFSIFASRFFSPAQLRGKLSKKPLLHLRLKAISRAFQLSYTMILWCLNTPRAIYNAKQL